MSGCPYSKWNWEKECEVCELNGKPTNGAVKCDFGFDEECAEYSERSAAQSAIKETTR